MARTKISSKFRARLSEKLMELGNLTVVALTFIQLVGDIKFSKSAFLAGILLLILCYFISYLISE